jgi:polysaccharide export outer membrane protein
MNMRLQVERGCVALALAVLLTCSLTAHAQYIGSAVASPAKTASAPDSATNSAYGEVRIVPGDIVSITTYGAPELSTSQQTAGGSLAGTTPPLQGVKVGAKGEIVLPYLGVVPLSGLTPAEASAYLSKALKDGGFLVDPQVTVALLDSPTRVITVLGEVLKPAPVPAFGQLRLLDAISACGGFTALASHSISIHRLGVSDSITVELGSDPKMAGLSNIQLMAGDTVIVPKVGNVFVVGEVKTPAAIPLAGNAPITVMRAIAMAGGVNFSAALSQARIIRTTGDNRKIEIMLDLKKVMFGKQQDIALVSDDVLYIPMNGFKAALANGAAGVASSALYGGASVVSVLK